VLALAEDIDRREAEQAHLIFLTNFDRIVSSLSTSLVGARECR
jgi:hypothetical protein